MIRQYLKLEQSSFASANFRRESTYYSYFKFKLTCPCTDKTDGIFAPTKKNFSKSIFEDFCLLPAELLRSINLRNHLPIALTFQGAAKLTKLFGKLKEPLFDFIRGYPAR